MILFQVIDLAAKVCGEPHIAPTWEIAKASLGSMLAKTPDLAERAKSIMIQFVGPWDPTSGIGPVYVPEDREFAMGDVCLSEFLAACRHEEDQKQAEADGSHFYHKNIVTGELDEIPLTKKEVQDGE